MSSLDEVLKDLSNQEEAGISSKKKKKSKKAEAASANAAESNDEPKPSVFLQTLFGQLMTNTKAANDLPAPDDFKYYQTFPEFKQKTSEAGQRVLSLISHLCAAIKEPAQAATETVAAAQASVQKKKGKKDAGKSKYPVIATLGDGKDDVDRFNAVTDVVDVALERVDMHLDEMKGLNRHEVPIAVTTPSASRSKHEKGGDRAPGLPSARASRAMLKPQRRFRDKVDNTPTPWNPPISEKPNAQIPLSESLKGTDGAWQPVSTTNGDSASSSAAGADAVMASLGSPALDPALASHLANLGAGAGAGGKFSLGQSAAAADALKGKATTYNESECYMVPLPSPPHPYLHEIAHIKYPDAQLKPCKERLYKPLDETPLHEIDTEEALTELAEKLTHVTEIAIDLEHHSYRSYQGFTCLMQISTRDEDYLIDTLELRHCLHLLNSSFTDPKIVKVLHGADSDILWLQRDFGLYIVNLFDTGQCARVLEYPRFGLAYLLKHFCDVTADKRYQLADWRERPLSPEMKLYARMDTHYLLYIYDRLRNETLQAARDGALKLRTILNRSQDIALQVYHKDVLSPNAASQFCAKYGLVYTDTQLKLLQSLLAWRDKIARAEDESIGYVLPHNVLMSICSNLPLEQKELLRITHPTPDLVKRFAAEIVGMVQEAKSGSTGLIPALPSLSSNGAASSSSSSSVADPIVAPGSLLDLAKSGANGNSSSGSSPAPQFTLSTMLDSRVFATVFSQPASSQTVSVTASRLAASALLGEAPASVSLGSSVSSSIGAALSHSSARATLAIKSLPARDTDIQSARAKAAAVMSSLQSPSALADYSARTTAHLPAPPVATAKALSGKPAPVVSIAVDPEAKQPEPSAEAIPTLPKTLRDQAQQARSDGPSKRKRKSKEEEEDEEEEQEEEEEESGEEEKERSKKKAGKPKRDDEIEVIPSKKQKKGKNTKEEQSPAEFKAFNYSSVLDDAKNFLNSVLSGNQDGEEDDHFDPYKGDTKSREKGAKKPKLHFKSGNKSHTFSQRGGRGGRGGGGSRGGGRGGSSRGGWTPKKA